MHLSLVTAIPTVYQEIGQKCNLRAVNVSLNEITPTNISTINVLLSFQPAPQVYYSIHKKILSIRHM